MAGCPDPVKDVAALLTSELVTNAIVYGRQGGELSLCFEVGFLRLKVKNADLQNSIPPWYGIDSPLGREIVEALSNEFGVDHTRSGKTVWATIDMTSC
jgi:hypothetical protein